MKTISIFSLLFIFSFPIASFSQELLKIPAENWGLTMDLTGFKTKTQISEDSTMLRLSAINEKLGLNLSAFIEKVNKDGDKIACREYYWGKAEKSPLSKENVQKYETDDLAVVEHDTKKYNGQVVNYHSVNAYLAKNGYWIDVHISKAGYSPKDKVLFEEFLKSIAVKSTE